MNRVFVRVSIIALALLAGVILLFLSHQEKQQSQGDAIIAKYGKFQKEDGKIKFPWTLDCPPFGKQEVLFQTEDIKGDVPGNPALQNTIIITRRWPDLWGNAYAEIDNAITNQNTAPEDLTRNVKIIVDLPDSLLEESGNWSIKVNYATGSFTAQMVGAKAASVSSTSTK